MTLGVYPDIFIKTISIYICSLFELMRIRREREREEGTGVYIIEK